LWPKIISDKDLWIVTGQEDINLEIRKRWMDWSHTKKRRWGKTKE
jgi:hypothetical protein